MAGPFIRTLLRIILFLAGTVVLVLLAGFCWLYFYSRDLPDVRVLAQFAPTTVTQVSDPCIGNSIAIPYDMIGNNLRNAIAAVETSERDPGVLRTTFEGLASEELRSRRAAAWWYVSRTMCYQRSTDLSRQVSEIRTAIQLERRYSRRQLFTIFANRFYFGGDVIGIESASQHFFQKNPSGLTVAEASLIAGIMKNPSYYSPLKHPDRALLRRNEVIDAMIGKGTITAAQGEAAKGTSLGIAAQVSATSP